MNKLNRTNCSRHDTATPPSLIIKYLDNGGQDGGQLGGHALDQRGRDAVEAEGGHLSVGCEESGGRVKRRRRDDHDEKYYRGGQGGKQARHKYLHAVARDEHFYPT